MKYYMSVVRSSSCEVSLLNKIDVTKFMVWLIENYPESLKEMKENQKIQDKFKSHRINT
jgi:hypothetical protein